MGANRGPMVDARVEGDRIILELPFDAVGVDSSTGKSKVHASTRGNQQITLTVNGRSMPVSIGINVFG